MEPPFSEEENDIPELGGSCPSCGYTMSRKPDIEKARLILKEGAEYMRTCNIPTYSNGTAEKRIIGYFELAIKALENKP